MLTIAGVQAPGRPLSDVAGKPGTTPPAQRESVGPKLNAGMMFGVIVTVNVTGPVTHCPAAGVNVQTPEF